MDKILLIDAHNFFWRANVIFPAKAPIDESIVIDNTYVMTFNFFRNFRVLIEQFKPIKVFFCLEGHPQFRYDLYPEYKANRAIVKTGSKEESHKRFETNTPEIKRLLQYLPVTLATAEKYEADDLIASLVEDLKTEDVIIISGDTDFIQLLQKGYSHLRLYNAIKKDFVTAPVYPYLAWKSLSGDKADNIKGVVSDKKAQKLLADPEKLKEFMAIEENRANVNINRQLIEFKMVPSEEIILEEGVEDFDKLKEEFIKFDFQSLIKEPYWDTFRDTFDCLKI